MSQTKNTFASLMCAFLVVGSLVVTAEIKALTLADIKVPVRPLVWGCVGVGIPYFVLKYRGSDPNFESKFKFDELKRGERILPNMWYFVADEIFGQKPQERLLQTKKDGGTVEFCDEVEAHGLFGNAYKVIEPMEETGEFVLKFACILAVLYHMDAWVPKVDQYEKSN